MAHDIHKIKLIGYEKWKQCNNKDCKNSPTDDYNSCMECHLCNQEKKKHLMETKRNSKRL